MIGTVLNDRYQLDEELGRGGMGVVYRGRDLLLKRDVAVKLLSATGLGTEGQARMLQEAQAAANLNHPNIVAVYDVGQADTGDLPGHSATFIVTELVEGGTLRDYRPASIDEVMAIASQISAALEAAHGKGIIHRDLKPENVLVVTEPAGGSVNKPAGGSATQPAGGSRPVGPTSRRFIQAVKLADFGLARIGGRTRLTQEGAVVGTMSYMAPEIILGQQASAQSDLYALGVMLYELAANRSPFEGDTPTAILSQHIHAPVVPPGVYNPDLPPTLDRLVVQLLEKQPEKRPASAAEVGQKLDATVYGRRSTVGPQLNYLVRGRLVGRDREFAQAAALWQQASAGQRQVLLISGEPGIGKSRLAQEITTQAEISGGKVLTAECYAQGGLPYMPIAEIVRASFSNGRPDLPQSILADLAMIAPDLGLTNPDLPAQGIGEPEADQLRLYESFVALCGAISAQSPLLLVVDDLHWADSGSIGLLQHLARRSNDLPLMLIFTYREVELAEKRPARQLLGDLHRGRLATRIKLSRLDQEQTRDLLATLFAEDINPEFLEGIYRETEGNPFFVEEVCKALVDSGRLRFKNGRWQRPDMDELEIPQGVQVAIESRLERLSEDDLHILQTAALLGREFRYDMLQNAVDENEDAIVEALEAAETAQLIEEVRVSRAGVGGSRIQGPAFSFTHALIQSTLLAGLSTLRRGRLQRQVAYALEEAYPDQLEAMASMLGRFFAEAGEGEKAISYLLQAGDIARQVYAYDEAIEAFENSLLFLRDSDQVDLAARTLMKLGLLYHITFEFEKSRLAYEEGFVFRRQSDESSRESTSALPKVPHPLRGMLPSGLSFDPAKSSTTPNEFVTRALFSGLVIRTLEGEIMPDVALSWQIQDGGKRYIFHLREDVRWSDGEPVSAFDFEYALKRVCEPRWGPLPANLLYDVRGARAFNLGETDDPETIAVTATDDWTLIIELESPAAYFMEIMTMGVTRPVPHHAVAAYGDGWSEVENIVSNGPFRPVPLKEGEALHLERYQAYHGRFNGNLEEYIAYIVDPALAKRYEEDEMDHMWFYSSVLSSLRQRYPEDLRIEPAIRTAYFWFDVTRPPFDDSRVRRAFSLATDRKLLAGKFSEGQDSPATGGLTPPGIPGHVPGIALPYEPGQACQLLAEAGYQIGEDFPSIDLVASDTGTAFEIVADLLIQWRESLGIEVNLIPLPTNLFRDRLLENPPHIWHQGWIADYPDPDNFLRVASWRPLSGWHHEKYEELIREAKKVSDQVKRMALYREAESILVQEAPVVPYKYTGQDWMQKKWVRTNLKIDPILKDVIIDPH